MLPSEDVELLCPLSREESLAPGFSEGDPSLISRALSLPQALRETVHLHYSLVTILTYCVQFNLNDVQPLSLFDSAVSFRELDRENHLLVRRRETAYFRDSKLNDSVLTQAQSALSEDICEVYTRYNQATSANVALSNQRTTFLRRSIEACVQVLPETFDTAELNQCQTIMSRLVDLAHSWDIDPDVVNKEYVVSVFTESPFARVRRFCRIRRVIILP